LRRVTQRRAEAAIHIGRQNVDRRIAHFANIAVAVAGGGEDAESAILILFGQQHREARIELLAHLIPHALGRDGGDKALFEIQRMRRLQVHRGAQRTFLDIGRGRLAHGQFGKISVGKTLKSKLRPVLPAP
jgi:uncharacterized membrane protein YdbT with pleckstrin-like domain